MVRSWIACVLVWLAPAAFASGSWATQVGGNLRGVAPTDIRCSEFVDARFYRVGVPVAWGVEHEFVGLVWQGADATRLLVTGLNGDGDLGAFRAVWSEAPAAAGSDATLALVSHTRSCAVFIAQVAAINRLMDDSAYNSPWVYALAMASRPLTGQPCSNMADAIEAVLRD